jgi:hypothetical protein
MLLHIFSITNFWDITNFDIVTLELFPLFVIQVQSYDSCNFLHKIYIFTFFQI